MTGAALVLRLLAVLVIAAVLAGVVGSVVAEVDRTVGAALVAGCRS